ncbi:MAG: ATP-binding protein [Planctomycetaceae bacterium]|nr:ATP-binding protein [Planctomycetaceae bacterium]
MLDSWTWTKNHDIPSSSADGQRVIREIVDQLHQHDWARDDVFGVHLALEEAVVNAIKHGNGEDPQKRVQVITKISSRRCWIQVQDEGPGFNPQEVPDCTLDENLEKCSGRGLLLMRNFMSLIEYNEVGNQVVLEKVLD